VHNYRFAAYGAMFLGQYAPAIAAADDLIRHLHRNLGFPYLVLAHHSGLTLKSLSGMRVVTSIRPHLARFDGLG
jgi:hypothetical protein